MVKQKDIMWYVKSAMEVIQIFIFIVCLIGFVFTFMTMWVCQKQWVSNIMGLSFSIGLVNLLFLISFNKDWREDYGRK